MSNSDLKNCPRPDRPEYAFIGRSNVGKSSLINILTNNSTLAKISSKPGKTRLINHFMINEEWYLVDLPGYGYANVPKSERLKWEKLVRAYILKRMNLYCLFVLIDSRHKPQVSDIEFIYWLGQNQIPFALVFTKADKLNKEGLQQNIENFREKLLETWEEIPDFFVTSSRGSMGKEEILDFIEKTNKS